LQLISDNYNVITYFIIIFMSIDILARRENDLPINGQEADRESVFATRFSLSQLSDDGPARHFKVNNTVSETWNIEKEGVPPYTLARAPFDPQVNGTLGLNGHTLFTNTFTSDAVRQMARDTMATGTTRFCPTIITSDISSIVEALNAVEDIPEVERKALGIEGVHVEGRWIDMEKKGIHNPAHIVDEMTNQECGALCVYAKKGILKIITVSPTKVTPEQIRQLTAAGALVSIGHSIATTEQVTEAIHAGAKHITHLWNAMSGTTIKHRDAEPGVVTSALNGH
jgi:N-acetylglucosamine-6-phosphate deacetylase